MICYGSNHCPYRVNGMLHSYKIRTIIIIQLCSVGQLNSSSAYALKLKYNVQYTCKIYMYMYVYINYNTTCTV